MYVPAGIAVIAHVNTVSLAFEPAVAPVNVEQDEAAPVTAHVIVPPGAVAPTTPVTVAV